MRFLPFSFVISTAVASDPCTDLCNRDGPAVCTQGSWNQNGICHAYFFRGDASIGDYCYHNTETASTCPSTGTKVRVEDATRLLAQSGTTTTTEEPLQPASPARIAGKIDGLDYVSRPWRSHPKAHFENTLRELNEYYARPADPVQFWKDAEVNNFMDKISKEYSDDTWFIIHIAVEIADFLGVRAEDREAFGRDTGFAAACAAKADLIAEQYQTRISVMSRSESDTAEGTAFEGLCPDLLRTNLHMRYSHYLEMLAKTLPENPDRTPVLVSRAKTSWTDLKPILLGSVDNLKLGLDEVRVSEDAYGSIEELMTLISSALLKDNSLITVDADGSAQLSSPPNPDLTHYTAIGRFLALGFLEGVATAIPFPASFYTSMFDGAASRELEVVRTGFNDLVPIASMTGQGGITAEDLVGLNAVTAPDSLELFDLSVSSELNADESARVPTPEAATQRDYFSAVYAGFDAVTKKKFWRVMTGLNWTPASQNMVNRATIYLGFGGDGELKWSHYNTQTYYSINLPSFPSQDAMRAFLLKVIETAIAGRL